MVKNLVNLYLSMNSKKWDILDAVFSNIWNFKHVPVEIISNLSKIPQNEVEDTIRELSDDRIVVSFRKGYIGASLTFTGLSLSSLRRLVKEGEVDKIGNYMGEGKESVIYNCISNRGEAVIKFHRTGHSAFKKVREKRDYGTYHYSVLSVRSARNEYNALKKVYGISRVPKPIASEGNAVLMELIDAKELFRITLENPKDVLEAIIEEIKNLYKAGIIHGDLSQYNILAGENGIWFIDFPQYVNTDSNNADEYLRRDLKNILSYFKRKYGLCKQEDERFDIHNVLEYVVFNSV